METKRTKANFNKITGMGFGNFKAPKNCSKYYWTRHSVGKMMQYGLSAQRVIRVVRSYQRIEEGIAKNTVAVMQPNSTKVDKEGQKKWSQEIWVMYQTRKASIKNPSIATDRLKNDLFGKNQIKIISVWRYPGVSPENNPIPEDILGEVENFL